RHQQRHVRFAGHLCGPRRPLVGRHAPEEEEVAAAAVAEGKVTGVDPVMDDAGDGQRGGRLSLGVRDGDHGDAAGDVTVDVAQLGGELAGDGGEDGGGGGAV